VIHGSRLGAPAQVVPVTTAVLRGADSGRTFYEQSVRHFKSSLRGEAFAWWQLTALEDLKGVIEKVNNFFNDSDPSASPDATKILHLELISACEAVRGLDREEHDDLLARGERLGNRLHRVRVAQGEEIGAEDAAAMALSPDRAAPATAVSTRDTKLKSKSSALAAAKTPASTKSAAVTTPGSGHPNAKGEVEKWHTTTWLHRETLEGWTKEVKLAAQARAVSRSHSDTVLHAHKRGESRGDKQRRRARQQAEHEVHQWLRPHDDLMEDRGVLPSIQSHWWGPNSVERYAMYVKACEEQRKQRRYDHVRYECFVCETPHALDLPM